MAGKQLTSLCSVAGVIAGYRLCADIITCTVSQSRTMLHFHMGTLAIFIRRVSHGRGTNRAKRYVHKLQHDVINVSTSLE